MLPSTNPLAAPNFIAPPKRAKHGCAKSGKQSGCKTRQSRNSTGCATGNAPPGQSARMPSTPPDPAQPQAQSAPPPGDGHETRNIPKAEKTRLPRVRRASNDRVPRGISAIQTEETSQLYPQIRGHPRDRNARWPFSAMPPPRLSKPRSCRKSSVATAIHAVMPLLHLPLQLPHRTTR